MPASSSSVRHIQWATWANECVLLGSNVLVLGGAIGIVGGLLINFMFWLPVGIYGAVIGLLISILEYPRGKKTKGNTLTRWHQEGFSTFVNKLICLSNYYARTFIYLLLALPGLLIVPTLLGGVFILIGCGIYLGAAIHGENWSPVVPRTQAKPTEVATVAPPQQPPPRLPQSS